VKRFSQNELREALAHAAAGGVALHLHRIIVDRKKAPRVFVQALDRGEDLAHLFDQDIARLKQTAFNLGVRVVLVHHPDTPRQHVDLVGGPLRRALAECEPAETQEPRVSARSP
jgi:hypothetical protein